MKNRYWQQVLLFGGHRVIMPLMVALLGVMFVTFPLMGQNSIHVSGVVKDATTGGTLPGVNVLIKGTSQGTATDMNGKYSLTVPDAQDTLIFSYIGYESKVVPINGQQSIDVSLISQAIKGQEMVVVGYGVQKRSDLSSSIASVSTQQLQTNSVLPNAASALQGTTAGVSVTPSSGAPGAAINIRVRGSNTFGDNQPLVIIDGAPGSLNDVNPSDIQSIQVLKDAAAAAIYGSRAANGVVIVTTKKGHSGKVNVEVKTSYGTQSPQKFIPVANAQQYAQIDNALHNASGAPVFPQLANPSSLGKGTDWQRAIFNSAPLWNAYMAVSGGDQNSTYRLSGSFNKQNGIATDTWYRKSVLHYNGQQNVGVLTFGESIGWTNEDQRTMPYGGDKEMILQTILAQPIIPVYDSTNTGGYGGAPDWLGTQAYNPVGLEKMLNNTNHNDNFATDVYGQLTFLKHFSYKLNASLTVWNGFSKDYQPSWQMSSQRFNLRASLNETRARRNHWLIENTLHYNQQFGQQNISALVGLTAEEDHYRSTGAYMEGFPNNSLEVISAGTGYLQTASGNDYRWDLYSLLGRINYSFADKYYLTANVRRDGSSRFGSANQYGIFPSASVAWRISNESFFTPLKKYIDNFKFRASYGVLGNQPYVSGDQQTTDYAYISTIDYNPYLGYIFGQDSNFIPGATIQAFANSDVKWETTKDLDLGFDMDLLNNVSLTADYYLDKTDNVLLRVPIPPSTGASSPPLVNTGKLQNQGIEVSLSYQSPTYNDDFNFNVSGNISSVRNKVLQLGYEGQVIYGTAPHRAATNPVTAAQVGYPIGAFFLMQADGLFQSQAEINNYKNSKGQLLQPNAKPGDVKYLDVNGDGIINTSDVAYSGSPFPKFSYGLNLSANYKHFDFTLFIQGTYGNKMFDANTWITNRGTNDYNFNTDMLNAWTPSNTNTNVPRLTYDDPNHNSNPSTRFLYDASYLRFRTVQIGYNLPHDILNNLGISKVRVYVNAQNLWTLTSYPGYNPSYTGNGLLDRGLDQALYPISRNFTAGIDINF